MTDEPLIIGTPGFNRFTAADCKAFDRWWGFAEQRNREGIDEYVRRRCEEMEQQFKETDE